MFVSTRGYLESRRKGFMAPHDPTITFHPMARNTRPDPTIVANERRDEQEQELAPAGTEGFFDGLPEWLMPVLIGVAVMLALALLMRKRE